MDDVPPPPPPHGEKPRAAKTGGLPDGKYDIFVIPPSSAGSGFLYLPSLNTQRNSFLAGCVCTATAFFFYAVAFPVAKEWFYNTIHGGGSGVVMMILGVGVVSWALGKTQGEGVGSKPSSSSYFKSNPTSPKTASGPPPRTRSSHRTSPQPDAEPEADNDWSPPPPPPPQEPTSSPPPPQQPTSAPPPEPPKASASAQSEPAQSPTPKPKSSWQRASQNPDAKSAWEKAREETRRREEERKRAAEIQRRRDDLLKERERLREKEAVERLEREWKEKKAKEEEETKRADAELKVKQAREEADKKAQREKEKREREAREGLLRAAKEAREAKAALEQTRREEKERKEREEKEAKERAEKEQSEAQRAADQREAEIKAAQLRAAEMRAEDTERARAQAEARATEATAARVAATSNVSSNASKKPPMPSARTERDDDAYSFRPYDRPRTQKSASGSVYSDDSYAPSASTARTTPPASVRGAYNTKDPNKIIIKGVYSFNNAFMRTPISQLISGQGNVTDGLILRITTEGLFIDDDVRGVPQREWDVKAWTLKLCEVSSGPLSHRIVL